MAAPVSTEKCKFISTEANHDFNDSRAKNVGLVLSHQDQKKKNFRDMLSKNNLFSCGNLGPSKGKPPSFYNDDNIVKYIFGKIKKEISNSTTNIPITLSVKTEENGVQNADQVEFTRIDLKPSPPANLSALFNPSPFSDAPQPLFDPIFLVIDVDSTSAIDNLITLMAATKSVDIYVIHSAITLADMANKRLPNSPYWATASYSGNVRISSWLFNVNIEIDKEDVFMSNYKVGNFLENPLTNFWRVNQEWKLPNGFTKIINNCSEENELPKCAVYYMANKKNPELQNLAFQRKRSGDYFQIWFAKNFPVNMGTGNKIWNNPANFNLYGHNHGAVTPVFPVDKTADWYRERTYFMSGDWPATSYAVYNKVNTFWGICGSGYHYTSRFKF